MLLCLSALNKLGLARTRWIVADMARGIESDQETRFSDTTVSEVMVHVFIVYATYKLPFKKAATVFVKKDLRERNQSPSRRLN